MPIYPPYNEGSQNFLTLSGNTAGASTVSANNGIVMAGGTNVTLSANAGSVSVIGPNQSNQQLSVYATGNTTQSSSGTPNASSLIFNGGGIVSVGVSNGSVVISATGGGGGGIAAAAGTQTQTSGTLAFVNSNGISFGMSNSSQVTASYTVPTQSVQTVGVYAGGNTTGQSSSSTADARSLSFSGAGVASVGWSNGSVIVSVPPGGGGDGYNIVSMLTSTSGGGTAGATFSSQSVSIGLMAGSNITLSQTSNTINIVGPTQTVESNTFGISNLGNTAGTSGTIASGQARVLFAGGNNITLSQSINGGSATITVSGANQSVESNTFGISNLGNTSGTSGVASGAQAQVIFAGGNNVTLSQSVNGASATITVSAANQSVQTQGLIPSVSGTNSTGGGSSFSGSALQLMQANGFSFIVSSNSVSGSYTVPTVTAGSDTIGMSNIGNTAGTSGVVSGDSVRMLFAGGNNITLSQSLNGVSGTITISAANQSNQQMTLFATGNTTQSSSGTPNASSLIFNGAGNVSVGVTNGSVVISATTAAQTTQSAIRGLGVSNTGTTLGNTGISTGVDWAIAASGNITASQSTAAGGPNTIWLSVPNQSVQTQNLIQAVSGTNSTGGASNFSGSGMVLAQANGFSFIVSNNSVSGSYTVPTQTVQTEGFYAVGNTTGQSSSSTFDARTLSISGAGIASVGYSAGQLVISVPSGGGGGDGVNIVSMLTSTSGGGTAGATFSTLSGSIGLMAGSNITLSQTSNTINIVGPTQTIESNTFGMSNLGNTSGTSGVVSANQVRMLFAGGNNITLSQSLNGASGTITIIGGAGGGGGIAAAAGTQTQTSGTMAFVNSNNFTFGMSNSSQVTASFSESTHGHTFNQIAAGTQTAANSSTVVFSNSNNVTFGMSNSSIITASFSQSVQTQNLVDVTLGGNSTSGAGGYALISSGTMTLAGGNNITISQNGGNAVTISAANQSNQQMTLFATGNTTQSSSGTPNASSLIFNGAGIVSVGVTNGSVVVSATTAAQTTQSAIRGLGVSNTGTTAGNTGVSTGVDWVIGASGNITASQSTAGGGPNTIWLSVPTQTVQTQGLIPSVSGTNSTGGGSSFSGSALQLMQANGFSFIVSNNSVSGSYTVPTVTAGSDTFGMSNLGNTSGTSGVVSGDSVRMLFAGGNNITLSQSLNGVSGTITIIGAAGGGGGIAAAAGTQTQTSGTVVLSNSNNFTFGMSNSSVITASFSESTHAHTWNQVAAGTQTAANQSTVVFSNSNNVSFGMSNSSIVTASFSYTQSTAPSGIAGSGASTVTNGTVVFANANGVSFGLNGSTMTASISDASNTFGMSNLGNTSGTSGIISGDQNQLIFAGGNNITLSQSINGSSATITIIGGAGGGGGIAAAAGTQTQTSGTLLFANSNSITFGMSNSSVITASFGDTDNAIAAGGVTFSSNASGTLVFSNSNNVSFGIGGVGSSVMTASASFAQSTQPAINAMGVSNTGTTAGNTGTFSGVSFVFAGSGGITASQSTSNATGPHTIWYSVPAGASATGNVGGIAGSGASTVTGGTVVFANSNGMTFGLNGSTMTASAAVPDFAAGGVTYTANTGTLVFSNSNNVSFGIGGVGSSVMTATATFAQTTQSAIRGLGVSNTGTTAGNTGMFTGVDWVIGASGNITASGSTTNATGPHTLWLSVPTAGGAAISAAGGSQNTGTVVFSNSNGISFGFNAGTITATVTPGAAAGIAAVQAGTQTQTSGTLNFVNSNGVTFGLSGSSQITASVAAAAGVTISEYEPWPIHNTGTAALSFNTNTSGTLTLVPFVVYDNIAVGYMNLLASMSYATIGTSSGQRTIGFSAGLYSEGTGTNSTTIGTFASAAFSILATGNNSTYSINYPASTNTAGFTTSSTSSAGVNVTSNFTGLKMLQMPINFTMTPGRYYLGMMATASSSSVSNGPLMSLIGNAQTLTGIAPIGQASSNWTTGTNVLLSNGGNWQGVMGFWTSAGLNSLPSTIALSSVTNSGTVIPYMKFYTT